MSSLHSADQCEPNLVPILDMVFQLITFFMLVINFKAGDVDKDLVLPVVGAADPADEGDQGDLLVLNVRTDGSVKVRGALQPSIDLFLRTESRVVSQLRDIKPDQPLPVTTVLRVDKKVAFETLMKIVDTCKANRFSKIDFVVVRKKDESAP
ncbi:MAG: biopolymer transporter ExbD [Planctomycetota bacterium]|nr:biopolymer transporter ExbD [Planctomycetota bacterium]